MGNTSWEIQSGGALTVVIHVLGARNGLRGCLRVVSYEETCLMQATLEIFSFTVGVYVLVTLSKWTVLESILAEIRKCVVGDPL